MEQEVKRY